MSISYPLSIPYPTPSGVKINLNNVAAMSQSQFTGVQQVQEWPGEWLELEVTLPKMLESDAASWRAFFAALRGQVGTFTMGPAGILTANGAAGSYWRNWLKDSRSMLSGGPHGVWSFLSLGGAGVTTATDAMLSGTALNGTILAFPDTTASGKVAGVYQPVSANARNQTFAASVSLQASTAQTIILQLQCDSQIFQTVCNVTTTFQRFSVVGTFTQARSRTVTFGLVSEGLAPQTVTAWAAQLERAAAPTAYAGDVEAVVSGALQAGQKTITTSGWLDGSYTPVTSGSAILRAGDWIQIGTHLHLVENDVIYSSSPALSVDIWPRAHSDISDQMPITVNDPGGIWRLSENIRSFSISPGSPSNVSDFNFKCREVL